LKREQKPAGANHGPQRHSLAAFGRAQHERQNWSLQIVSVESWSRYRISCRPHGCVDLARRVAAIRLQPDLIREDGEYEHERHGKGPKIGQINARRSGAWPLRP
jgi:hypothetical protein